VSDIDVLADSVRAGDRTALGRAITLVESTAPANRSEARALIDRLLPHTGSAMRVGVSGVPGVGKSTFIEVLGSWLLDQGRRVAVLTVDPSSIVSGGSILGDKTRMVRLARREEAFIRPSPAAGSLGGVTRRTRESLLVCEAGGFDIVLVETVGVGQSETLVADMVDLFVLLLLPGGGDELQGIKRGILEVADLLAVNKSDGANRPIAERTRAEYASALRLVRGAGSANASWLIPAAEAVLSVSAREETGIDTLWEQLEAAHREAQRTGALDRKRADQLASWMWATIDEGLLDAFRDDAGVRAKLADTEKAVREGRIAPTHAAERLLSDFGIR
jgi:LAO/AO transport system kinase